MRVAVPKEIWPGWTRLYQLAWFLGCFSSGLIFLALDYFWPMPEKLAVDEHDYFGTFGDPYVIEGLNMEVESDLVVPGEKEDAIAKAREV